MKVIPNFIFLTCCLLLRSSALQALILKPVKRKRKNKKTHVEFRTIANIRGCSI